MLPPYLKIWDWDWIFGRAVKAIFSLGVHSPWLGCTISTRHFRYRVWKKCLRKNASGTRQQSCCFWHIHTSMQCDKGKFEPGKAQYSTPNFFHLWFLIRVYWNAKSKQDPGLGGLASRGSPARILSHLEMEILILLQTPLSKWNYTVLNFFYVYTFPTLEQNPQNRWRI